jgi:hypothetical protein
MADFVYVYSAPNGTVGDALNGPEVTASARAKELGAIGIRANSLSDLRFNLDNLKKHQPRIDRLVIETHGSPGAMYFGNERLDSSNLSWLTGRGYEEMFVENARVFLNGCNIAEVGEASAGESNDGRVFMKEIGKIFLAKGGGRVGASTSIGLGLPTNKVYHLWGDTVYVFISKGGQGVRFAQGKELSSPLGRWHVKASNGEEFYYWFSKDQSVNWDDGKVFGGKSGQGMWATGKRLAIAWQSGSTESWDLPLFSEYQTGVWKKSNGEWTALSAEKLS